MLLVAAITVAMVYSRRRDFMNEVLDALESLSVVARTPGFRVFDICKAIGERRSRLAWKLGESDPKLLDARLLSPSYDKVAAALSSLMYTGRVQSDFTGGYVLVAKAC